MSSCATESSAPRLVGSIGADDDEPLRLHPKTTEAPGLKLVHYGGPGDDKVCMHYGQIVYRNRRLVVCDSCGAHLDPIEVLARIAQDSANVQHLSSKRVLLGKRIEELERLESNARSRVKRLTGSVPTRDEIGERVDGRLRCWAEDDGTVHVWTPSVKVLSPEEAEREADRLRKVAWEARGKLR